MNALFKFFLKYGIYILFVALEVLSIVIVAHGGAFQRSKFYALSHSVAARAYAMRDNVTNYASLRLTNEQLSQENIVLRNELMRYKQLYLSQSGPKDSIKHAPLDPTLSYESLSAKVVNNSIGHIDNYLTLNRGRLDGILPDMSVITGDGVVGFVESVSDHFAIVMPILNPKAQLSCKIAGKNTDSLGTGNIKDIGSLVWKGGDTRFAHMQQVPKHVPIQKGDHIVTSGYSDFFPEGIDVGTIESFKNANDDNYYDIIVRLSVNFHQLQYVEVLNYKYRNEQISLQDSVRLSNDSKGGRP